MREVAHSGSIKIPQDARQIVKARLSGYKAGGAVAEKAIARDAVHKHEEHDHPDEKLTRIKRGGGVKGKKSAQRLDKRARGGGTGMYKGTMTNQREIDEPQTNVDSEAAPKKRARGGRLKHGKHHTTNVIVNAGGGQQDAAAAHQQGVQEGAMKTIGALKAKMAGAGAGAPPMGGPPPGAGAMPGSTPAPPMAAAMPPLGRKRGGGVPDGHVEVKKHTRRKAGGKVGC